MKKIFICLTSAFMMLTVQGFSSNLKPELNIPSKAFFKEMRNTLDPKGLFEKCSSLKTVYAETTEVIFTDKLYFYYKNPNCYMVSNKGNKKKPSYSSSFIKDKFYVYFEGKGGEVEDSKVRPNIKLLKDYFKQYILRFDELSGNLKLSDNIVTVDGVKCRELIQKNIDYMSGGVIKYFFNTENYQLVKQLCLSSPDTKYTSTDTYSKFVYKTVNQIKFPVSFEYTLEYKNQPKSNNVTHMKLLKFELNSNIPDKVFTQQ